MHDIETTTTATNIFFFFQLLLLSNWQRQLFCDGLNVFVFVCAVGLYTNVCMWHYVVSWFREKKKFKDNHKTRETGRVRSTSYALENKRNRKVTYTNKLEINDESASFYFSVMTILCSFFCSLHLLLCSTHEIYTQNTRNVCTSDLLLLLWFRHLIKRTK